jgi:hypothetical protein
MGAALSPHISMLAPNYRTLFAVAEVCKGPRTFQSFNPFAPFPWDVDKRCGILRAWDGSWPFLSALRGVADTRLRFPAQNQGDELYRVHERIAGAGFWACGFTCLARVNSVRVLGEEQLLSPSTLRRGA